MHPLVRYSYRLVFVLFQAYAFAHKTILGAQSALCKILHTEGALTISTAKRTGGHTSGISILTNASVCSLVK